jgi:cell division transport system permease protein
LLVVAVTIVLFYNVNNFTILVEKDVTIVAFLDKDIDEEKSNQVIDKIKTINGVESYVYKTKEEVKEEMMESSEDFENIMKEWSSDENPLYNAIQVKVKDIEEIGTIAKEIEAMDEVKVVKYGEGMVEQLIGTFDIIHKISIGIVIALIIVTAFLISNTIKITIFSRQREIEIMRLVGASNLNIKIPFIFEGLFLGMLGSVIPIIITIYGYTSLYSHFNGQVFSPFIKLIEPVPFMYYISLILLGIGILVGMFGSWRAVKKYLKI